jgi:excisionase family DNA binding protein
MNKDGRTTITEAARVVGVSAKTIRRWEEAGKVPAAKKDWRGWRVYFPEDVERLVAFHEALQ